MEIHRLTRSHQNRFAPINRLPPEVLSSIPDFWDDHCRKKTAITLTHVCREWRHVFISRPSLWTDFRCLDADKTRVYLERSKHSPINLRLEREDGLLPNDPFLQISPYVVHRFKSLFVDTSPDHLQDIVDRLSYPAPLLNDLFISGSLTHPDLNPVLSTTLFDGDISSLHRLDLLSLRTDLPWRNMANLTLFSMFYIISPRVTVGQLLDFFESAPRLSDVELRFSAPEFTGTGRSVSMSNLRTLQFSDSQPSSLVLNHLLIPVGAELEIELDNPGLEIENYLPGSLDNLKNLLNFNKIFLRFNRGTVTMELSGPNGQVAIASLSFKSDPTHSLLRCMTQLGVSKVKTLEILGDPLCENLHRALVSMENLQAFTLSLCQNPRDFILALNPDPSPKNPIPCPKLKTLLFRTEEGFDIGDVIYVAAVRAERGVPFQSVKIVTVNGAPFMPEWGVRELRKHVSHVCTGFRDYYEVCGCEDDSDQEC